MFGVQPARDELYGQGWSITDAAIELDINRTHLNRAVLGYNAPCDQLRESLPRLLNRPLAELFTEESLKTPYGRSRSKSFRDGKPARHAPHKRRTRVAS